MSVSVVESAVCPTCRVEKPLEAFAPDPTKASGHRSYCRPCDNERSKAYYVNRAAELRRKARANQRAQARYEAAHAELRAAVREAWHGGMSTRAIAAEVGLSYQRVAQLTRDDEKAA